MRKSILVVMLILILSSMLVSCTENTRARNFGGNSTIELKRNERLVNVTFKEDDLWILTKYDTTAPTKYEFQEKSSWGILEGTVTIVEQ
jgi:predicted small secreted protein